MDRDAAALERDPRAALLDVERVRHPDDPGLDRQRPARLAVTRDRLQHLGADDGQLGLLVDPVEQLAHLRLGEEKAPVLVAVAVHGHADAVQERAEHDHDLGVLALHAVVGDHRRLDAALGEDPEQPQADVGHDLDVHPRVVVDTEALDRVHIRDVPPGLQAVVGVDALQQRAQLRVPLRRHLDPHLRRGLGGREARLTLGFLRNRLVDALLELVVQLRHAARDYSFRPHGVTIRR